MTNLLAAPFGLLLFFTIAPAQVHSQIFGPTTGPQGWNVDGNWTPSGFPNGSGASATFNSLTGAQTVNLNTTITAGSITLTNTSSNVFTLSNGTGGSLTMQVPAGEAQITLNGTSTTTNNLTISASVALNSNTRVTINQTGATGTAVGTFTGAITGTSNFIKDGPGRLSFTTTTKAFTGSLTVAAGRLSVSSAGAPTGTSAVTVQSGGMLMLNSAATWNIGGGTAVITLNGAGTGESNQGVGALRAQAGGANSISNPITLGSNSTIHIDGGTSVSTFSGPFSGGFTLTKSGAGNMTLTNANPGYAGGTTLLNGSITVNSGSNLGTGALRFAQTAGNTTTVTLNNSAQSIGSLSSAWEDTTGTIAQTLALTGTALTINQTTDGVFGPGAVSTLTSVISGSGSLIKQGGANLTLGNANTYAGGTIINDGSLIVNNPAGSGTGTGSVTVNSGGTLSGTGIISGPVTVNSGGTLAGSLDLTGGTTILGTHSPGFSPGIDSHTNLTYAAGSNILWELIGNTISGRGTNFDGIDVGGNLNFSGSTALNLAFNSPGSSVNWTNALWTSSQTWDLFTVTGTISNLSNLDIFTFNWADANGALFNTVLPDSAFSLSQSGNIVQLNYAIIPEPSRLALLGLASGLLLLRRRRP